MRSQYLRKKEVKSGLIFHEAQLYLASPSLSYPSLFFCRRREEDTTGHRWYLWNKILLKLDVRFRDLGVENQYYCLFNFTSVLLLPPSNYIIEFKMACAICRYGHHPPSSSVNTTRKVCATIFCRLYFYTTPFSLTACHQQINT